MSQLELIEPCADWDEYLLSDVARTTSGGTPDRSKKDYYNGTIPWVKSGELDDSFLDSTEEHISEEGLKKSSAKLFPAGTLLMAMYGATVGKTAILKIEAATNQAICGIFPDETKANTEFLRYQLVFFRKKLLSERYGGAQPNISQTIIKNIRLRLPPLPEQHRIARVLATVQTAIEQQARLIALTRELKSALMCKLFTEGLRGEKQKETEIGLVPESWDVVPLQNVARDGFQNGAFIKNPIVGKGVLFANVVDMYHDVHVNFGKLERIDVEISKIQQYLLQEDDVLVVRSSLKREGIGQNSVVKNLTEPVFYDCHLIRVKPDTTRIVPEFLSYFWRSDKGKQDLIQRSKTTTMTTINQATLAGALMPVPSYDEQSEIANMLLSIDAKIQLHRQKQEKLEELFRTLLHQLMTGQIRV
jgi:type I restriction enzyme S subunit